MNIGLPRWLSGKESTCKAGDLSWIPRSGRSPGPGNGNPLQYSCLENPMNREAWWVTVHWVTKSQAQLIEHTQPVNATLLPKFFETIIFPQKYICFKI